MDVLPEVWLPKGRGPKHAPAIVKRGAWGWFKDNPGEVNLAKVYGPEHFISSGGNARRLLIMHRVPSLVPQQRQAVKVGLVLDLHGLDGVFGYGPATDVNRIKWKTVPQCINKLAEIVAAPSRFSLLHCLHECPKVGGDDRGATHLRFHGNTPEWLDVLGGTEHRRCPRHPFVATSQIEFSQVFRTMNQEALVAMADNLQGHASGFSGFAGDRDAFTRGQSANVEGKRFLFGTEWELLWIIKERNDRIKEAPILDAFAGVTRVPPLRARSSCGTCAQASA